MSRATWIPNSYPPARRSDHVDIYKSEAKGQVRVADPYQWLEEYTDETNDWISSQETFTRSYLDKNPDRQRLEDALRSKTDYVKFSAPTLRDDGRWYWYCNSGLQAQHVMYRSQDDKLPQFTAETQAEGEVFFDPNLLSKDGTAAIATTRFSPNGKYFAYGISQSGSDGFNIYVRATDSPLSLASGATPGEDKGRLSDELRFVKFSGIEWVPDNSGFLYQRYPENPSNGNAQNGIETKGDQNAMVYYHKIGTQQSEDILIHSDKQHPDWMWGFEITEDGRYFVLYALQDSARKNKLWVADLTTQPIGPNMQWNKLFDTFDAEYTLVTNDGPLLYIRTDSGAPQNKLITVDIANGQNIIKDLIPEDKDAFLGDVDCVNERKNFVVRYMRNVKDELYIYSKSGTRLTRLAPEFLGSATTSGREKQPWFFISLTSFTTPQTVIHYDFREEESKRWKLYRNTKVKGLELDDFSVEQVWYTSKDGTKVPMFLVRHKSTKRDGTAPAIQYGYGGFSIPIVPSFNTTILTFLSIYGAVYASPNIRGGSEFGEEWHKAGYREKKGNVFDDFIAATEYLIREKIAGPGKVAINGGSNGGLLVAACVNRAPEGTFGAAVAEVGVHDLLKFSNFTIGKAWISDYGDPSNPHDFDFIHPLSPLHNVPQMTLPPTLLLTADHDDRVVPMHSFKLAATLQHLLPNNPHPLLLRVDKKAGHGAGKSTDQRIKEHADKWGFVAQSLGLPWQGE